MSRGSRVTTSTRAPGNRRAMVGRDSTVSQIASSTVPDSALTPIFSMAFQ